MTRRGIALSLTIIPESSVEVKWHERLVARFSHGAAARSRHSRLLLAFCVFLADESEHPLTSLGTCCMLVADILAIVTLCTFRQRIA